MKQKLQGIAAGLGLAQLLLMAPGALAQDTSGMLDDVVITSTKLDQKQSQTGKVITVINREVIEKSYGKTVPQLLSEQAGVYVNGAQSNLGKDKALYLRGASNAYTLVLIDGMAVNDPSIIGAVFDLRLLSMEQVERIEILKGGQSTLYGSDAVAGVINIITRRNSDQQEHLGGVLAAGSYGNYKGSADFSGGLGKVSYNFSYTFLNSDGITEAAEPADLPPSAARYDIDPLRQNAALARLSYSPGQAIRISPFARYQYLDSEYDNGAFSDADNRSYTTFITTGINSEYAKGGTKLTLNYSYSFNDRVYKAPFASDYKGKIHIADLFLNQALAPKLKLLAGLENRFTKVNQPGAEIINPETNLFSTYASLAASDLGNYLDIEAGGRYNRHDDYGDNFTFNVTPSMKFFDNGFRLFGTVAKAFKAPTLTELFGAFGANPALKPQKADNYEVGFSLNPSNAFSLRVAAFERYINDAIIYGATGYVNLDKQDDYGTEIESGYRFGNVTLNGFYAFVKGKTLSSNAAGQFVKSEILLRRPKHSFGLNAGIKLTEKFSGSINFRSYGSRNDAYFDSNTFATVNVVNGAYQLLDVYAEYQLNSRFKIFVNGNNLLDSDYVEVAGYKTYGINAMGGIAFRAF
jgi:vitamin B12 transporter